jgi:mRNA interferase RelE/StbE
MTYSLEFKESALKEWRKLDAGIQKQFKTKLRERLEAPHVPSAKLSGMDGCYKIKLRSLGYRLVYEVQDDKLIVSVVGIGRRDKQKVYKAAAKRL